MAAPHGDWRVPDTTLVDLLERNARHADALPADYFDSLVYLRDGEAHLKSDGAVRIADHLDRPWGWLRWLRHVPRPVRDAGYDLLGRVRYRLFGRREECMVPDADLRTRFLGESTDGGDAGAGVGGGDD